MKRGLILLMVIAAGILGVRAWRSSGVDSNQIKAAVRRLTSPTKDHSQRKTKPQEKISMPRPYSRKPQPTNPDEIPYVTMLRTLQSLGEWIAQEPWNNKPGVARGKTNPSDSLSLLQRLLFSDPEKGTKSSKNSSSRKNSKSDSSRVKEGLRSSLLSRLTDIQYDENGKMLLELFTSPSNSGSTDNLFDLFSIPPTPTPEASKGKPSRHKQHIKIRK